MPIVVQPRPRAEAPGRGAGNRWPPVPAGRHAGPVPDLTGALVRTAHADAWAVTAGGRPGGAVADLGGARAACSGLPFGPYNGTDLLDPATTDPERVAAWWAARGTPWAWRTPPSPAWPTGWPGGDLLVHQRLAGLRPARFAPAPLPAGVAVRRAAPQDLDAVVAVDVAAFGGPAAPVRRWLAGHLENPGVEVGLVLDGDEPVATAHAVRSDGAAGPAVLLAGVGVVPGARRRGVGAGLSSWLLERALAAGAALAHLQPDDDRAARVYARLGFTEVEGLDVRTPG